LVAGTYWAAVRSDVAIEAVDNTGTRRQWGEAYWAGQLADRPPHNHEVSTEVRDLSLIIIKSGNHSTLTAVSIPYPFRESITERRE